MTKAELEARVEYLENQLRLVVKEFTHIDEDGDSIIVQERKYREERGDDLVVEIVTLGEDSTSAYLPKEDALRLSSFIRGFYDFSD